MKNKDLEVHVDLPLENYQLSRFDWTGKIVKVNFRGLEVSGIERTDLREGQHCGRGFYNEFGIESPPGFREAPTGGWFHKIGVGLLKKTDDQYHFHKAHEVKPCAFNTLLKPDTIVITCKSEEVNGYAYLLKKEMGLTESGFEIRYSLQNTGDKTIVTDEYNHNFIAIDHDPAGMYSRLTFPFLLTPERFRETINPEGKVDIGHREITFNGTPEAQFFFSQLNGGELVKAEWEIVNRRRRIGIRETGNFQTTKVNLWGWTHVISPELFIHISLLPGRTMEWSRMYEVFSTD